MLAAILRIPARRGSVAGCVLGLAITLAACTKDQRPPPPETGPTARILSQGAGTRVSFDPSTGTQIATPAGQVTVFAGARGQARIQAADGTLEYLPPQLPKDFPLQVPPGLPTVELSTRHLTPAGNADAHTLVVRGPMPAKEAEAFFESVLLDGRFTVTRAARAPGPQPQGTTVLRGRTEQAEVVISIGSGQALAPSGTPGASWVPETSVMIGWRQLPRR